MSAQPGSGPSFFATALVLTALLAPFAAPGSGLGQTTLPAPGQVEPAEGDAARQALETIETSITLSHERAEQLRREIEDMSGDRTRQNAALIAAAQRVKLAEIEVNDIEERLDELIVSEMAVRGRLDGADASIANVLAALERISRNPPPALIVDPTDALGSARGAILISAILPQLQTTAQAVKDDLNHLSAIKAEALREEALLKANFSVLEEEQLRIATLLKARGQGLDIMTEQLQAEEQEAIALAARAASVKDLIAALESRANSVSQPAGGSTLSQAAGTLAPEAIRLALANTSRTEPALPFAAARGYLTMPSNGDKVVDFGAGDGFGGIAHGLSVMTRPQAQVVAPADGWVMYQGPYLNYGQIIILNPGDDYTILLAGLDTVGVSIGQFVLMGEPLGTMGSHTIGRTVSTSAGNARPTLYIELRKDNEPVDPTGWWDLQTNPTQSG